MTDGKRQTRAAWLAVGAAVITVVMKALAYGLTDSVGLLSDALESLVNIIGAGMLVAMMSLAMRPADDEHPYGHSKAEYLSIAVEGVLIVLAAIGVGAAAIQRMIAPVAIAQPALGMVFATFAMVINGGAAALLIRAGRSQSSSALAASGQHLLTDVWTTLGAIVGVGLVSLTGIAVFDPLIAIVISALILRAGLRLLRESIDGILDSALSADDLGYIEVVLERYRARGIDFHALRTRKAGALKFVSVHVLVPDTWTVRDGHALVESVESDLRHALADATIFTHLEPIGDATAYADTDLRRQ
jgi:cation diffusion facilitator family transporter